MVGNFHKAISKHIIEIRFRPDARFLDRRGAIASSLSFSSRLFKHWNISPNRIDFTSENNPHVRAFFSYRNLGLVSVSPNETAFFVESAESFVKSAWSDLPNTEFSRIGVRSMLLVETDNFEEAVDAYLKHFLKLTDEDLKEFGGNLIDVGIPINFADDKGTHFNVVTGPMEREQAKQRLGELELPPVGFFVDVDYFRKNFSPDIKQKNVLDLLKDGVEKAKLVTTLIVNRVRERG